MPEYFSEEILATQDVAMTFRVDTLLPWLLFLSFG
jgi:hypothetical protein